MLSFWLLTITFLFCFENGSAQDCLMNGVKCSGQTLPGAPRYVHTYIECSEYCSQHPSCQFWTWYKRRCFLREECTHRQSKQARPQKSKAKKACRSCNKPARYISGPRGCPNDLSEVMLITGSGNAISKSASVEVFDPANPSWTCNLPNMGVERNSHAAVDLTVCGGWKDGADQSCESLQGGNWEQTFSLQQKRRGHYMWGTPNNDLIVMGDRYGRTTETLQDDGSSVVNSWDLQHDSSFGCSIDLGDSIVITGGSSSKRYVTKYQEDGSFEELPQLITGRYNHGCGSYMDSNDNLVLIVTAGFDENTSSTTDSTEIQVTRSSSWQQVEPYPTRNYGLRGATVHNVVYMTGGGFGGGSKIYKYENGVWTEAGTMKESRHHHAVTVVKKQDIVDNCS